jgi:hypothetical protein
MKDEELSNDDIFQILQLSFHSIQSCLKHEINFICENIFELYWKLHERFTLDA